ncbi:MAG: class I SAM-dependent methyltransferase [Chloroflexota bacterium]
MSFNVAAEAYDAFMGRYSQGLSPQLADLAGIAPGLRVLDVGRGPGALVAELVRRTGADHVSAVDPSVPFVRAVEARYPGVDARVGSAEALPFDEGTFDATLAQLVVHFMADPVAGLAGMARVTRVGGVVAASVWDHASDQGPLGLFWRAARDLDPTIHDESRLPGVREGHLAQLLEATGMLTDITHASQLVRVVHPTFEDWWQPFTRGVGPAGAYVATLDDDHREALRSRCEALAGSGPITITGRAWAARGFRVDAAAANLSHP